MLICPPSVFEAKLSIQCKTCTTSFTELLFRFTVCCKISYSAVFESFLKCTVFASFSANCTLIIPDSWHDLFYDWYGIIIARTMVLTNLITNFSKKWLQFILQHTKCSRKWWFLGAYNICICSTVPGALTAEVCHKTEPIIINHIGQWNICICLLSMQGWLYYINMELEGPCDARWYSL